jgi:surfeit locus 1 family protein
MRTRGGLLIPAISTLAGLVVLIGLGVWQLERKTWKEALIARLERRLAAVPVALLPPDEWPRLTPEGSEFLRVTVRVQFQGTRDALLYTSGSPLRDDVKSPGYFVFAPGRLSSGAQVVVNRGYVPGPGYPSPSGELEIVGVLRWPEAPSWFVSDHDSAGAIWFVRDPRKMAQVRSWGQVAPFYVEQESPVQPGGLPHPSSLVVRLRNDHLQYALTWFGLAGVLAAIFMLWFARWRVAIAPERAGQPQR